jgi:hypothetical protein
MKRSLLLFLLLLISTVFADDSKNRAENINFAYTAWGCAHIAAHSETYTEHADRLFRYGMDKGKQFMEDVENGRIEEKEIHETIFWIINTVLTGGGGDFMLGRLFQLTEDEALKEYTEQPFDKDVAKMKMDTKFREKNCNFIGR